MSQSQAVNAEIIAIGTELLLGEITDTNSVFIARTLRDYGINVYYMTTIGDNRQRIADVIRNAMTRANLIITCGGLGPTVDDMTRQAIADACDVPLVFHQTLLDQIAARFASFRVQMTQNNQRQAYLPQNAVAIENPVGTAPAFIMSHNGVDIISLPGVPREMKYLMTESVIPYLRHKHALGIIKARVLKTAGIGESMLDELIGPELLEGHNPTVGLAAHSGQIDVRITAKAQTHEEAQTLIAQVEQQLVAHIGKYIYGYDDDKLEQILIQALERSGQKLSVVEAGTGGLLARMLNQLNADILAQAMQYDTPDSLRAAINAAQGGLRDLAATAAEQSRQESGAAVSIAIVTLPDITEGADTTNEATAVAVASDAGVRSRVYGFGGLADFAPRWVSTWAMSQAWGILKEKGYGSLDI